MVQWRKGLQTRILNRHRTRLGLPGMPAPQASKLLFSPGQVSTQMSFSQGLYLLNSHLHIQNVHYSLSVAPA